MGRSCQCRRDHDTLRMTLVVTAHRERYLDEALASVDAQRTDAFALILVADSTGERAAHAQLEHFAAGWDRSPVSVLSHSGGSAGPVRNAGIAAARTDWVAYLDGDDVLHPDAMATVDRAADTGGADLLSTGLWHVAPDGTPSAVPASLDYAPHRRLYLRDPELAGETPYLFQLTAVRREVWQQYPYYAGGPGGDDLDFVLHHLLRARFRKVPLPLYGQRRVPDGFSDRARRADRRLHAPCPCPCSRRYRDGYYRRLLQAAGPDWAGNFVGEVRWTDA